MSAFWSQPSLSASANAHNPAPQCAPGASAALGHTLENSIPLSIFPIKADKLCVCFCGLPARGKTHISRRLARYLSFFHALPVQIFNLGEYRRRMCGAIKDADWFNDKNSEAMAWRLKCNQAALSDMVEFLENVSFGVAILDGTNGTHEKRLNICQMMRSRGVNVQFIEVDNNNPTFLTEQYKIAVQSMPDYEGMSDYEAEVDYRKRVATYTATFQPMSTSHPVERRWSFLKCDHSRHHFVVHNVRGHLPLKIVNFIMNLRTTTHAFYLSRHGQSEYNLHGRIGGDSGLSEHGINYAKKLAEFSEQRITKDEEGQPVPARLWTSTMRRAIDTTQFISHDKIVTRDIDDPDMTIEWIQMRPRRWCNLDEIYAGMCDGMTYEEIEAVMPGEYQLRQLDKLAYRYPRGESYLDVIARIEPIIIEMERHK